MTRYLLPLALLFLLALFAAVDHVTHSASPAFRGEAASGAVRDARGGHPPAVRVAIPPRPHASPSRASRTEPLEKRRSEFILTATAYTDTGHRTASGQWPRRGIAASNMFPLGTRLFVQGVGVVTVLDRIGCCSQLDIYLPTERMCREFGRRQLHVWVLS